MTYDRYGNRTAQTVTAGTGPSNSVSVDATTNRIVGLGYDANGNMTNDGSNTLVYDGENRALSATNGSTSGTYAYDGNGLRVTKVAGGTTTVYVFSGGKVIAEYDNGAGVASPSREYIYSGAQLLAKIESGGTTYYHADHLSARLLTDSSGNTLGQRGHYPFGETWYETGTTTKFKFTTYERDGESGNDYALARSYVNRLGRFSSLDPLGGSSSDPQSLNRYSYARLNPMSFTDPSGKELCWGTCTDEWGGGGYAGYGGAPSGPGGVWGTTGADPSVGGGHWQAGVDQCGVNPFCLANPPGPPSSPVAQINCTTGKWCMVGSYNFSQQNNDGTWTVDWQAQWNRELSDVIAAFWNQAVRVYLQLSAKNQNLSFEDFVGFQNLDTGDPNALQPKLQGGNWNFLYDGAAQPSDCASGVGGIRCGTSPSLHYPSEKPGYVHMDTANPAAWWYGGSIVHGIVDVVLGNTFFANGIPR